MKFYRQCVLKSENRRLVAWIEERGAKVGYSVTLKDSSDPKLFWEVIEVSEMRLPEGVVRDRSRDSVRFKNGGSIAEN